MRNGVDCSRENATEKPDHYLTAFRLPAIEVFRELAERRIIAPGLAIQAITEDGTVDLNERRARRPTWRGKRGERAIYRPVGATSNALNFGRGQGTHF
jgi:hypothetical protein